MKNLKTLERLQLIHKRITNENTGTPKELANFMRISERLLFELLNLLKDYGAPIMYSRARKTYFYTSFFDVQVNISVTILNETETLEIFGGSYLNINSNASFMQ